MRARITCNGRQRQPRASPPGARARPSNVYLPPRRAFCLLNRVSLSLSSGFARMRIVSKGDDLWVDQDSIPMQDLEWVTSIYGAEPKRTEILCTAKNGAHGTNVVTKNAVREMLEVNPLNPLPTSTLLGP